GLRARDLEHDLELLELVVLLRREVVSAGLVALGTMFAVALRTVAAVTGAVLVAARRRVVAVLVAARRRVEAVRHARGRVGVDGTACGAPIRWCMGLRLSVRGARRGRCWRHGSVRRIRLRQR